MNKRCLAGVLFCLFPAQGYANELDLKIEPYPQVSKTLSYIYDDYLIAYDRVFTEESIPYWWAVGLSTAVLIAVDDKLIVEAQKLGTRWGIAQEDKTASAVDYKGYPILRLPNDLGSSLYFIGDGWTHASIAAGFLATGAWTDDDKAFSVGYQLIEGMATTTVGTQFLKHITGRESPSQATEPTGRWDFFPNQQAYFENVAKYDAFPSGHLAVASMTLTVIHKNYPDNAWVMPVGITLLSALSFQMMNNEVHWASDYPLAIAMGYTFGSIAYERGARALASSEKAENDVDIGQWVPIVGKNELGVGVIYQF